MSRSHAFLAAAAAAWLAVSSVVAGGWAAAQVGKSVWDGVYSDDQAARGKKVYVESCASCHQEGLQGADLAPPLKGADFVLKWSGFSVQDIFTTVANTMPADSPGKLAPQENADVLAYVMQVNKFPAGRDELKPDAALLKAIAIGPKP